MRHAAKIVFKHFISRLPVGDVVRHVFNDSIHLFARNRLEKREGKSPHHEQSVSNSECHVFAFSITDVFVVISRDYKLS